MFLLGFWECWKNYLGKLSCVTTSSGPKYIVYFAIVESPCLFKMHRSQVLTDPTWKIGHSTVKHLLFLRSLDRAENCNEFRFSNSIQGWTCRSFSPLFCCQLNTLCFLSSLSFCLFWLKWKMMSGLERCHSMFDETQIVKVTLSEFDQKHCKQ